MHYVDRGPEPVALKKYRDTYTAPWVDHYERGRGTRPNDTYWRRFHERLRAPFSGLCGYCEAECKGEVDHFRPKSVFPRRVYVWANWVFACHDCNNSKGEQWPDLGYIDPCSRIRLSRPEQFFDFDLKTGEITPKASLSRRRWERARTMIADLKLNAFHQLRRRLRWISLVSEVLEGDSEDDPGHRDFVERVSARTSPLSSITRAFLAEQSYFGNKG